MKGNSSSEGLRATLASAWCDSAGQRLPGQKQAADIPAGKHQPPCSATPGHTKHITVQNASPSSVAQAAGGDASLHGDVMSPKAECFLLPCGPCRAQEIAPSQSFCLPHPSGKALKLACAVLQQTVECFFRDLSPGQGSWVLQQ